MAPAKQIARNRKTAVHGSPCHCMERVISDNILKYESNYHRRLAAESWFIHTHRHIEVINRYDAVTLPI